MKLSNFILTVFAVVGISGACAKPISIGVFGPYDPKGPLFLPTLSGIKMAVEDFKSLLSADIQLNVEYTGCDKANSPGAVKKLLSKGAVAVIGDLCSGATAAAYTVAAAAKVPVVSPAATSPTLSGIGPYFFRTIPNDVTQALFASFTFKTAKISKLAIWHPKSLYGYGLSGALLKNFQGTAFNSSHEEFIPSFSKDITAFVKDVVAKKVQAVYIITGADSAKVFVPLVKALKAAAPGVKLYGSEANYDTALIKAAGMYAEGMIITAPTTGSTAFKNKYLAKYKEFPGAFAPQGYDAARAVILAIQATKMGDKVTGEAVAKALPAVTFTSAAGDTLKFDKNGDISGGYVTYMVKSGVISSM